MTELLLLFLFLFLGREGRKELFDAGGGKDDVWAVTPAEERRLSHMFQQTAAITQQQQQRRRSKRNAVRCWPPPALLVPSTGVSLALQWLAAGLRGRRDAGPRPLALPSLAESTSRERLVFLRMCQLWESEWGSWGALINEGGFLFLFFFTPPHPQRTQ